mgnify:FL=1
MRNIKQNVTELIGGTPLVRINNIEKIENIDAELLVKFEAVNPGGSAKDRPALNMIAEAEKAGTIKPGGTIIEPTSGNTGVGLAMVAASRGYKAIMVMPETMSIERRKLLAAYGAEIVLTEGAKGMAGAVSKAEELNKANPNSIIAGQFVNPANSAAHFASTGPEIWHDTEGQIDIFVAGIGTGGTITGVGAYLKKQNPEIKIVAVEPYDSPLLSQGKAGPHKLQGIGANFVPEVLDTDIYDEIITVTTDEAMGAMKALAQNEGLFAGITSGAAVNAALRLAKRPENKGKTIVAFLPDTGERYLSVLD